MNDTATSCLEELLPSISPEILRLYQCGYGALLLGTILMNLPNWRTFFISERFNGYVQSASLIDRIYRPSVMVWIQILWITSALVLLLGAFGRLGEILDPVVFPAAFIATTLAYQFHIRQRWTSLSRGLGAPGFMTWWCGLALLLLDYCKRWAPGVFNLALLTVQIDLAVIMFSAGVYKALSGYPQNHGFELGLVNPMWSYWWKAYRKLSPRHILIKLLNQGAWSTEIIAAVLMVLPSTRLLGAALLAGVFAFIGTHIRLGLLTQMVILPCLLFIPDQTYVNGILSFWLSNSAAYPEALNTFAFGNEILIALLIVYLVFRPLAWFGLSYNYYSGKQLPRLIQVSLDRFANAFGIILWRVFTPEVTCFYVEIYAHDSAGKQRHLSTYSNWTDWRFGNVAECITITTIFTALKYFSDSGNLFRTRLLRHARTLPLKPREQALYKYVMIQKQEDQFEFKVARHYLVDVETGQCKETIVDDSISVTRLVNYRAETQSAAPGSYART